MRLNFHRFWLPQVASATMAILSACTAESTDALLTDGPHGATPQPDAAPIPDATMNVAIPKATVVPVSPTGPDRFFGVTFDALGNIYATGQVAESTATSADVATVVAKFKPDGTRDDTFGTHGIAIHNVAVGTNGELFRGIVVQSDGKVVTSGTIEHVGASDARDRDVALLRLNTDGTRDTSFGTNGVVTINLSDGMANGMGYVSDVAWGLQRYSDDRLVLSGAQRRAGALDTDFIVARLSKDGVLDDGFGTHGVFALDLLVDGMSNNASARNLTILPGTDGIVAAGYQPVPGRDTEPVVYKITDAGQLDLQFGTQGAFIDYVLDEQAECYAARPQGTKLVTTGYGRSLAAETSDILSLRLNADGTLDKSYGQNGLVRIDIAGFGDNSRLLEVLPDNRVLLIGGGRQTASDVDGVVVLLTPDGAPDTSFAPNGWRAFDLGGPADFLWSVALSPNQKTAAIVGVKGVGANPTPAGANDDAALLLLPLGE